MPAIPNCLSGDCVSDLNNILSPGLNTSWPAGRIQIESALKTLLSYTGNVNPAAASVPNGTLVKDFRATAWPNGLPNSVAWPYLFLVMDGDLWYAPNNVAYDIGTVPATNGTGTKWANFSSLTLTSQRLAQGRLTGVSGDPTGDSGFSTTLYYTPYTGNVLTLYNGSRSQDYTFSEFSLSVAGIASSTNYDVYCYINAGVPTLELLAWTNATTQAVAPVRFDGYWVKTGQLSRRWLGTIRANASGSIWDGPTRRFIWNVHNQVPRSFYIFDNTVSWTCPATTTRPWNNLVTNFCDFVRGLADSVVTLDFQGTVTPGGASQGRGFIGFDNTSVLQANEMQVINHGTTQGPFRSVFSQNVPKGYHSLTLMENNPGATANTYYGLFQTVQRSAAIGSILA